MFRWEDPFAEAVIDGHASLRRRVVHVGIEWIDSIALILNTLQTVLFVNPLFGHGFLGWLILGEKIIPEKVPTV